MTRVLPTIPNFVPGPLASAQLNTLANAVAFSLNMPCFRMYQGVSQNIANVTDTQMIMDTPDYDSDLGRSGVSPYSYTIPSNFAGRWHLAAAVLYVANGTGLRTATIRKNGVVLPDGGTAGGSGVAPNTHGYYVSVEVPVNAGDIISVWTYQSSTVTLATSVSTAAGLSYFEGRLVSLANP